MSEEAENLYFAENLGVVGEGHYKLLGSFFENNGITRVRNRLPFISRGVFSQDSLPLLEGRTSQDPEFARGYRSGKRLHGHFGTQWLSLEKAANQILCEEYVRIYDMVEGQALISGRRLVEEIGEQYADPSSFPDALLLSIDDNKKSASLERVYAFKTRLEDSDIAGQGLLPRSDIFRVSTEAIGQVIGIPPENISVPNPPDLPIRLVVSEREEGIDSNYYLREKFNGGVVCIELPNIKIRHFTYFVLRILTGKIQELQQWEGYFTEITPGLAPMLDAGLTRPLTIPAGNAPQFIHTA